MDDRAAEGEEEIVRVLSPDGTANPAVDPHLSPERVRELYEAMVLARRLVDALRDRAGADRLGWLPRLDGAEAAVIGAASTLREGDWLFGRPRDLAATLLRGASLTRVAQQAFAAADGPDRGRRLPGVPASRGHRIGSVGPAPANHIPHAVGVAWAAARHAGEDTVVLATLEGAEVDAADFHTGVNFAGVLAAPVVLSCRTRPGEPSAAGAGVAYGVEGVRCDGTDLLAVVRTVADAVSRASRGDGPMLVDLVLGGESPLPRTRRHLEGLGAWDDGRQEALDASTADRVEAVLAAAEELPGPHPATLVEDVYAELPPHLARVRARIA
ncbi:MAG: thiamine pyrophosphate-dependent dehydrogenase E1 component subunit alpha [Sandaracinaceae bacterium]